MGNLKICRECSAEKVESDFYSYKNGSLHLDCKKCHTTKTDNWKMQNKEKNRALNKAYNDSTSGKRKEWYKNNSHLAKPKIIKRALERRQADPQYKARYMSTVLIGQAIRQNQKSGKIIDALGCSIEFLRKHIESKFTDGMTWKNRGRFTWHIDHIIPLSKFDLLDPAQFAKANHYTNLQPLHWEENLRKGKGA